MTTKTNMSKIDNQLIDLILDNPTRKDIWFIDELNQDFDEDELLILYERISQIKDEYRLKEYCLTDIDIEIVDYEH